MGLYIIRDNFILKNLLGPAVGRYLFELIPFRGKRGAACGKRLTFLCTPVFRNMLGYWDDCSLLLRATLAQLGGPATVL